MRIAILAALLTAACGLVPPAPTQYRTEAEEFNARWVGHSEDDVVLQYGSPTEVLQLSSGNRVDSYHKEVFVSSSRGGAYGQVASSRSDSTTIFCYRRFEIDKSTQFVARAVITGSSCDYSPSSAAGSPAPAKHRPS